MNINLDSSFSNIIEYQREILVNLGKLIGLDAWHAEYYKDMSEFDDDACAKIHLLPKILIMALNFFFFFFFCLGILGSRFLMEFAAMSYNAANSLFSKIKGLDLSNLQLTRLDHTHRLSSLRLVDLSNNQIRSINVIKRYSSPSLPIPFNQPLALSCSIDCRHFAH